MSDSSRSGRLQVIQEYSLPLLTGVAVAMLAANLVPDWYEHATHWNPFGGASLLGHELTLHFLVNDIFMVLFFGVAAKEITESCLPGGSLNPMSKALNPLMATIGGVVGPVGTFFLGLWLLYQVGVYSPETHDWGALQRGWGVPTATDIALAWLVARTVFGRGHPAVDFLLLLAVADDAIGLAIIAIFYGDPTLPARPEFLLLVLAGMGVGWGMRRAGVRQWWAYVLVCGPLSWLGLILAHLHPALALVFIVWLLPGPRREIGTVVEGEEADHLGDTLAMELRREHAPLQQFEHRLKPFVDYGLFFFGFTNAGVALAGIGPMTWLILASLVVGKVVGISAFGLLATRLGFPLPSRMGVGDLLMASFVAALGLTVALFVASAAFVDPVLLGQAKMGALFSGFVGLVAIALGRAFGMRRRSERPAAAPAVPAAAATSSATPRAAEASARRMEAANPD